MKLVEPVGRGGSFTAVSHGVCQKNRCVPAYLNAVGALRRIFHADPEVPSIPAPC